MTKKFGVNSKELPIESLQEIKEIELGVLISFREICDKYKLRYSLAYGTLLGAVRHKGFIPWDDDIDVMMPRPDYLKFIKIAESELKDTQYSVISMYNNEEYFSPLTKMYDKTTKVYQYYGQNENVITGVYIDIFVIDGLPNNNADTFYDKAQKIRWKWGLSIRKITKNNSGSILKSIAGVVLSLPFKIRGFKYYRDKYDALCSTYKFEDCDNIAVILYGEGLKKEQFGREEFDNRSDIVFEGEKFSAVRNPHTYLENMYGNYMELPPIEQRKSKHPHGIFRIVKS